MITIRNKDEMQKYYIEEVDMYAFNDDVEFLFDVETDSSISAVNINANDIVANNIYAWNIKAHNINDANISAYNIDADDISYYAICYAYNSIKCNSIKGTRENSKHFVLDGELIIKGEENK